VNGKKTDGNHHQQEQGRINPGVKIKRAGEPIPEPLVDLRRECVAVEGEGKMPIEVKVHRVKHHDVLSRH